MVFYVEHVRKSLRNRNSPQTSFEGYTSVQRAGFRRGPESLMKGPLTETAAYPLTNLGSVENEV